MRIVKISLAVMVAAVLLVTATFAWINYLQKPEGRYMSFVFEDGKAVITSNEVGVELFWDVTGDDDFVNITSVKDSDGENALNAVSNFAPGDQRKFRADIVNNGTVPLSLRMVLSGITCDEAEMLDYFEVGTSGFEGFPATTLIPPLTGHVLSDVIDNDSYDLVENVEIPPGGQTVSVYFYVIFSRAATNEFEGKSFTIDSINFMAI